MRFFWYLGETNISRNIHASIADGILLKRYFRSRDTFPETVVNLSTTVIR
jgi:hypothetical protein